MMLCYLGSPVKKLKDTITDDGMKEASISPVVVNLLDSKHFACFNLPPSPCNLPSEKSPGQFSFISPSNKLGLTTDNGVIEDSISPDVVNLGNSKTNSISILSTEPANNSNNRLPHLFPNYYGGKQHEERRWLNDRHINVTQELLQKQFPITKSLHNTLSGQLRDGIKWNLMEFNYS